MTNINVYHTSPNQKTVITKKTYSDKKCVYGKCNVDATLAAAKELSDRAFKLYVRMNLHQDKHRYALSPKAIQDEIGMSDKRYRAAVNELIDNGYLIESSKHARVFFFYEFPNKDLSIAEKYLLENKQKERKANKEKERQKRAVQNDLVGQPKQIIRTVKPDILPSQIEKIPRPNGSSTPAISGGEIERTITNNIINDTTDITTDAEVHHDSFLDENIQDYEEYMEQQMSLSALDEKTRFFDSADTRIIISSEDLDAYLEEGYPLPF